MGEHAARQPEADPSQGERDDVDLGVVTVPAVTSELSMSPSEIVNAVMIGGVTDSDNDLLQFDPL